MVVSELVLRSSEGLGKPMGFPSVELCAVLGFLLPLQSQLGGIVESRSKLAEVQGSDDRQGRCT